jgi:hypothetical protein
MQHTETQTQKLAREHVSTVADAAISNIRSVQKWCTMIVYGVMIVSYFHQAQYLYGIFGITWRVEFSTLSHAITSLVGAILIPVLVDAFTVVCIKVVSTVGLRRAAKNTALCFVVVPTTISGYINFKSSISLAVAVVYIAVVGMIVFTEVLRALSYEIDYAAIGDLEKRAMANAEPVASGEQPVAGVAAPLDPMVKLVLMGEDEAKELVDYDRMTSEQKQSWSRRFKNAKRRLEQEMADPVTSIRSTVKDAPVSPAGPLA